MAGVSGERTYDTGVESSAAVLPGAPAFWSYSALKEVEACPRRYALSRATYPALWNGSGYPKSPVVAALFGDVVHGALEVIVKALVAAGCESTRSSEAVAVLRDLGGYTLIAEGVLSARLSQFEGNPRMDADRRRRLERDLADRIPEARAQLQAYLGRIALAVGSGPAASSHSSGGPGVPPKCSPAFSRRRAPLGASPELTLAAEDLGLMGRIDLLTVQPEGADITDYKTGAEDPAHQEQLLTYAVLWDQDRVVNPDGIPVGTLTAAYPTHLVISPAPSAQSLDEARAKLGERISVANSELESSTPTARPGVPCGQCHVRQLCGDYWTTVSPDPAGLSDGTWFDLEGTVVEEHGVKSWRINDSRGRGQLLLRTHTPSVKLPLGRIVRFVGVRRVVDSDEADSLIAALGSGSETFLLAED